MALAAGCNGRPSGSTTVTWDVSFDTPAHALSASSVEVEVRRGSCTGELAWGPETLTRTSTMVMPPGAIAAGSYCLRATAIDGACVRFAAAEAVQDLRAGAASVSLVLAPVDAERSCPWFACVDGTCMPALADAGTDTGPPDLGIVLPDFGIVLPDTGPRPDTGPPDTFPEPYPGCTSQAAQVSAGAAHTCAIVTPRLFCWGADDRGQLGTGAVTGESRVPRLVTGAHTFTQVSAGGAHTCGITEQHLFCWGDNAQGQLGVAGPASATPVAVAPSETFLQVAAGRAHTCALQFDASTSTSAVWCWGADDQRQLGGPTPGPDRSTPGPVAALAGESVNALAAGDDFTCATVSDATFSARLVCWGAQGPWLGTSAATSPATIALPAGTFVSTIAAGARHACATSVDPMDFTASLRCWGEGMSGELGNGTAIASSGTPLLVGVTVAAFVSSPAAGDRWTCAPETVEADTTQRLVCFGDGASGVTGPRGTAAPTLVPLQVLHPAFSAEGGARHVCAIGGSGSLVCWGDNSRGQLGTGAGAALDRTPRPVCF